MRLHKERKKTWRKRTGAWTWASTWTRW